MCVWWYWCVLVCVCVWYMFVYVHLCISMLVCLVWLSSVCLYVCLPLSLCLCLSLFLSLSISLSVLTLLHRPFFHLGHLPAEQRFVFLGFGVVHFSNDTELPSLSMQIIFLVLRPRPQFTALHWNYNTKETSINLIYEIWQFDNNTNKKYSENADTSTFDLELWPWP